MFGTVCIVFIWTFSKSSNKNKQQKVSVGYLDIDMFPLAADSDIK